MIVYIGLWAIFLCVVSSAPVQVEVMMTKMLDYTPRSDGYLTQLDVWKTIIENFGHKVSEIIIPNNVMRDLDPSEGSIIQIKDFKKLVVLEPDSIGAQNKRKVEAKKGTEIKSLDLGKYTEKSYLLEKVMAAFPNAKTVTVHTQTTHTLVKEDTVITKKTPAIKLFQVGQIQGITVE